MLGGKRYYGDKDAMRLNKCGGGGEFGTGYRSQILCTWVVGCGVLRGEDGSDSVYFWGGRRRSGR